MEIQSIQIGNLHQDYGQAFAAHETTQLDMNDDWSCRALPIDYKIHAESEILAHKNTSDERV